MEPVTATLYVCVDCGQGLHPAPNGDGATYLAHDDGRQYCRDDDGTPIPPPGRHPLMDTYDEAGIAAEHDDTRELTDLEARLLGELHVLIGAVTPSVMGWASPTEMAAAQRVLRRVRDAHRRDTVTYAGDW